MVTSQTPTIAKIKKETSETDIRALLTIAVGEVCEFFNVGKNMNPAQIALTVDLIIENFWYFKLEEVKYCFRRAMMCEKLFDRLDSNIIIGWLREYDTERTEEAMRISDQQESQELNEPKDRPGAVSYNDYLERLRERAKSDKGAAQLLSDIDNPPPMRLTLTTSKEREAKDHDFKKWRIFSYLLKKNKVAL